MFFRILPTLARAGASASHVHDVFFPTEYPEPWIFERAQTWNEQYCLQAFLMNNSRYVQVETNETIILLTIVIGDCRIVPTRDPTPLGS